MHGLSAGAVVAEAACPIDHAHLGRYTMGSRPLEIEVLQLFAGQAPSTFADLVAAADAKSWHIAAHTLKGSARAVGAFEVGRAAEQAERAGHDRPERAALLVRIKALLDETQSYIEGLR